MAYFNPHRRSKKKAAPKKTARAKRAAKKMDAPKRAPREAPQRDMDVGALEERLEDKEL